jgi:hypothetical protein
MHQVASMAPRARRHTPVPFGSAPIADRMRPLVASSCEMKPPASMPAHEPTESELPPSDLPSDLRIDRARAIYQNQFGSRCDRFLLVEDNLVGKGLGWLRNYWAVALVVAIQSGRVLHQVPPLDANATRWCHVPPFTLECFFARWNDCASTNWSAFDGISALKPAPHHSTWGIEGLNHRAWSPKPVLRMLLSSFVPVRWTSLARIRNTTCCGAAVGVDGKTSEAYGHMVVEATRFLFRPRKWVQRLSDCVLRHAGVPYPQRRPPPFAVVFARNSAEKRLELASHAHGMPPLYTYPLLARTLATQLLPAHARKVVVVETSSAAALSRFEGEHARTEGAAEAADAAGEGARGLTAGASIRLTATDNPRSDHDQWAAKEQGDDPTVEGTVAAVNLDLASRAEIYVGLSSSAWTYLVSDLMDGAGGRAPGTASPVLYLCCHCDSADRYIFGGADHLVNGTERRKTNVMVLRAAPGLATGGGGAGAAPVSSGLSLSLANVSRYCREGPLVDPERGGLQVLE